MNLRQRSIIELKNAVINKTLGCYNENVVDEGRCLYFHGDTGTCCAVGAIIPHDELFNNVDDEFNVSKVFNTSEAVFSQLNLFILTLPFFIRVLLKSSSYASLDIPLCISLMLKGLTNRAESLATSGKEPVVELRIGTSQAIDSKMGRPKPSNKET